MKRIYVKASAGALSLLLSGSGFAGSTSGANAPGVTPQPGTGADAQGDASQQAQTAQADQKQSEERALHAIHILNDAQIRAAGIALVKPVTADVRDSAWTMAQEHTMSELQLVVLAKQSSINLNDKLPEVQAWQDQVDKSFELIRMANNDDFQTVYLREIHSMDAGLIKALEDFKAQGFTDSKVTTFVDDTLKLLRSESGIPAEVAAD